MSNTEKKIDLDYADDTPCKLQISCRETVSHWNDDYHDGAYDKSGVFKRLASIVASPYFENNNLISTLDYGFHLEDFDPESDPSGLEALVAQKLRELNPDKDFVISNLDMWDRKRGSLKMTAQVDTTVGHLRAALQDEKISSEILESWSIYVRTDDDPMKEIYSIVSDDE